MNESDIPENDERDAMRLGRSHKVLLAVLTASSFLAVMDFASVFIPLPAIMEELGGALDAGTWVIAAFVLAFAVVLMAAAALADRWGLRRTFLVGVSVFTAASIACAAASSMAMLIGARALLGIGAALAESSVYALIRAAFPEEKTSMAIRVQGSAFLTGALLAPVISGAITTAWSWAGIFWVNVVAGAAILAASLRAVPKLPAPAAGRKFDLVGLLAIGGGLVCLFFAIIEGPRFGWRSPVILSAVGAACVLLVLFAAVERLARTPLIAPGLLRNRLFALGSLLWATGEFASMGVYFAVSHFMQEQLGYSPLLAGGLLMAVIGGGLVAAAIAEPLARKVDARWLIISGFLLVAGGIDWLAHLAPHMRWVHFLAPLAVAGAGFAAQEGPNTGMRNRDVADSQAGSAWRISYSLFLLGIGLGVSVVSAIWQSRFLSNADAILRAGNIPESAAGRLSAMLAQGGFGGRPAEGIADPVAHQLVQTVFADAINAALLGCVAAALIGAVLAVFFAASRRKKRPAGF